MGVRKGRFKDWRKRNKQGRVAKKLVKHRPEQTYSTGGSVRTKLSSGGPVAKPN